MFFLVVVWKLKTIFRNCNTLDIRYALEEVCCWELSWYLDIWFDCCAFFYRSEVFYRTDRKFSRIVCRDADVTSFVKCPYASWYRSSTSSKLFIAVATKENQPNVIEAPKALDVQLDLPEWGNICFGGYFTWWQKDFSPVLSPNKLVKSKCRVCEVLNRFLACNVVSRY